MQSGFSWGTAWEVVALNVGSDTWAPISQGFWSWGKGYPGPWGPRFLKRRSVVWATRPAGKSLITSPVRGLDNGALFWGSLGPGEPSLFSPTLPPHPSLRWAGMVCIVEDDEGRHVLHSVRHRRFTTLTSGWEGVPQPPIAPLLFPSFTFHLTSHLLNFSVASSSALPPPDTYPIYLWLLHLLGLQSVLQPDPPLPAWRPASAQWFHPPSWHPLWSFCCGVEAGGGGRTGPVTPGMSWATSSGPAHC